MWGNYRWVAALDPVELSHDVDVVDLRVDEVCGRPAWRADLRARRGYDPRCGGNCCELIWSEAGRVCEVDDPADAYHPPGYDYPDHYDVAIDVQTGSWSAACRSVVTRTARGWRTTSSRWTPTWLFG